ncbi:unnamed protein product [Cuscuta campestris]|uniref:FHA domain-containing protein n=1 Tax=Cuscuta campestris TaxID=132261 RepID=A0A484LGJ8_9ASTE|nr:unnamed protein product [Cuscuta campestris]
MATTAPTIPSWIPEDDLLLKNSVEAGASLEALAKGAVQFSRRFTLKELQERWNSLLYDPDISEQASARIVELELSGFSPSIKFNKSETIKESTEVPRKRKNKSIHKHYYALQKKIRNDFFNSTDLCFLEGPTLHDFNGHGVDFQQHAHENVSHDRSVLGNCISDNLRFQEAELDILRNAFPEALGEIAATSSIAYPTGCTNTAGDSQVTEVLRNTGFSEGFSASLQGRASCIHSSIKHCEGPHVAKDNSLNYRKCPVGEGCCLPSTTADGEFTDLPDSLLNLPNDDEVLVEDEDVRSILDKSSDKNGILMNSSDCIPKGGAYTHEAESLIDSKTLPLPPDGTDSIDSEIVASSTCGQEDPCCPKLSEPSNLTSNTESNKLTDGSICCTLNTEDTEIPCNDDIFLLIHPSTSFGSAVIEPRSTHFIDTVSPAIQKDAKGVNSLTKGKGYIPSLSWSHKIGQGILGEAHAQHRVLSSAVKSKLPETNRLSLLSGEANKAFSDSSQDISLQGIVDAPTDRLQEQGAAIAGLVGDASDIHPSMPRFAESGSGIANVESSFNPSSSDQEEPTSDDDVPYFSDIEAMILDMDLDPPDQDSYAATHLIRYHPEESKRTIIRLEQCARSSMHRAMMSQGAFAILYGRHLRSFIKKREVILGRSTDGIDVDIDLRKEGNANKISRRQAIIKMEPDGSFFLRNIGKNSITVNGKTVDNGRMHFLSSSCLIEIKGMGFVFEVNKKYVRQHVDPHKDKANLSKFDWSPDG